MTDNPSPLNSTPYQIQQQKHSASKTRSEQVINQFLNYSAQMVKSLSINEYGAPGIKNSSHGMPIFETGKSYDIGGKQFTMPNPLFLMSALVSTVSDNNNNSMNVIWDELEERKTIHERVEERHAKYYHNIIKNNIHNHTMR